MTATGCTACTATNPLPTHTLVLRGVDVRRLASLLTSPQEGRTHTTPVTPERGQPSARAAEPGKGGLIDVVV